MCDYNEFIENLPFVFRCIFPPIDSIARYKERLSLTEPSQIRKQSTQKEERLMEENKRKKIEAKLLQLFAENDQAKNKNQSIKNISSGVKVIRRRKGKPDLSIY